MTFEEYAEALNNHADACPTCDASRKLGVTKEVCEEGRKIVDEWRATLLRLVEEAIEEVDADPR